MPDTIPPSGTKKPSRTLELLRGEVHTARQWLHSAWSREQIISNLKTLAWVVPLTVLIWVYAEREQLAKTESPLTIPIEVTSGDPTRVVTLIRPREKLVMADLEGPRSRVEAVKMGFGRSEVPSAINIVIDPKLASGQAHDINARTAMEAQFKARGVSVSNCQPPYLTVFVDTYEEIELPVEPPPAVTNLVGSPRFEPEKVRIRGPAKILDRAKSQGAAAYADLANLQDLKTPGPKQFAAVRILLHEIDSENVTVTPATVRATLEVRQSDVEYTIPSVPIYTFVPASMKKYRVECDDNISNVKVIGPPDQIEMIRNERAKPKAALEITGDDRPIGSGSAMKTRLLRLYDLPDGVRVAPDDTPRSVDFKLIERTADQ